MSDEKGKTDVCAHCGAVATSVDYRRGTCYGCGRRLGEVPEPPKIDPRVSVLDSLCSYFVEQAALAAQMPPKSDNETAESRARLIDMLLSCAERAHRLAAACLVPAGAREFVDGINRGRAAAMTPAVPAFVRPKG